MVGKPEVGVAGSERGRYFLLSLGIFWSSGVGWEAALLNLRSTTAQMRAHHLLQRVVGEVTSTWLQRRRCADLATDTITASGPSPDASLITSFRCQNGVPMDLNTGALTLLDIVSVRCRRRGSRLFR